MCSTRCAYLDTYVGCVDIGPKFDAFDISVIKFGSTKIKHNANREEDVNAKLIHPRLTQTVAAFAVVRNYLHNF